MSDYMRGYLDSYEYHCHTGLPSQLTRGVSPLDGRSIYYKDGWTSAASVVSTLIREASPDGKVLRYYREGTPPGILGTREPFTRDFGPMPTTDRYKPTTL